MSRSRFSPLIFVLLISTLFMATAALAAKPVPICGDGKCQGDETAGSCPADCATAYCGDGICNGSETYDNCSEDCLPPPPSVCNNDSICNEGEDCLSCPGDCAGITSGKPTNRYCCGADNFCAVDLCGADCGTPFPPDPYCGDGTLDPGEECDDGNNTNGDGCDASCTIESPEPFCGDRKVDAGEECDDGGETAFCDADCSYRVCGDGYTNLSSDEQCDTSGESSSCDSDCTYPVCGDNTLNESAGEECDDGNTASGDGCDEYCLIEVPVSYCGDGTVDPGEECDDGNNVNGDGCDEYCVLEASFAEVPSYQFNIGDSIGEGEAANGTIGAINHDTVWSTGYDAGDSVTSLNERFEATNANAYTENNSVRDQVYNHAVSGAVMANFVNQAGEIVADVANDGFLDTDGMITMLLGNNDVCAPTLDSMTAPTEFESQYRAGLDVLAADPETALHHIQVSGIPAIYWLWNAKRSDWWCRIFVWPNVPCENLLSNPTDDCANAASRLNPDVIDPDGGDGPNCVRRKQFHAKIRDIYNPILRDVLKEYIDDGRLPNAAYIDIFDVQFSETHVNGGDCFHPSEAGHALLSNEEWCRSPWENGEFACTQ